MTRLPPPSPTILLPLHLLALLSTGGRMDVANQVQTENVTFPALCSLSVCVCGTCGMLGRVFGPRSVVARRGLMSPLEHLCVGPHRGAEPRNREPPLQMFLSVASGTVICLFYTLVHSREGGRWFQPRMRADITGC